MKHIGFDGRTHEGNRDVCSRCATARVRMLSEEHAREVLRGNGNGQAPAAIDVRPDVIGVGVPLTLASFDIARANMKRGGRMTYVQHGIPHSSLVVGEVVIDKEEENEE